MYKHPKTDKSTMLMEKGQTFIFAKEIRYFSTSGPREILVPWETIKILVLGIVNLM